MSRLPLCSSDSKAISQKEFSSLRQRQGPFTSEWGCSLFTFFAFTFYLGGSMSLFSNLRTASSGLQVAGTQMSVIGDNIANVNTIGFKRGRATFSDSFPVIRVTNDEVAQ